MTFGHPLFVESMNRTPGTVTFPWSKHTGAAASRHPPFSLELERIIAIQDIKPSRVIGNKILCLA